MHKKTKQEIENEKTMIWCISVFEANKMLGIIKEFIKNITAYVQDNIVILSRDLTRKEYYELDYFKNNGLVIEFKEVLE